MGKKIKIQQKLNSFKQYLSDTIVQGTISLKHLDMVPGPSSDKFFPTEPKTYSKLVDLELDKTSIGLSSIYSTQVSRVTFH